MLWGGEVIVRECLGNGEKCNWEVRSMRFLYFRLKDREAGLSTYEKVVLWKERGKGTMATQS